VSYPLWAPECPWHGGIRTHTLSRAPQPCACRVETPSSESFAEHGRTNRKATSPAPLARRHQHCFELLSIFPPSQLHFLRPGRPRLGPSLSLPSPSAPICTKQKRPSGSHPKAS